MPENIYLVVDAWRVGKREEDAPVAACLDREDAEWLRWKLNREVDDRLFVVRALPLHAASLASLADLVREYQD